MRKLLTATLILFASAASSLALAQDILKPDQAYQYAAIDAGGMIEVDWAIEDGYYLYKKKLSFHSQNSAVELGNYELPQGLDHEDEFFGQQQIYRDRFYVSIPYTVTGTAPASFDLEIRSQGCADIGICYPPQVWTTAIALSAPAAAQPAPTNKFALTAGGGALGDFLPVDAAFKPYVVPLDGNTVEVSFQVAPGYYLYKDKIAAVSKANNVQVDTSTCRRARSRSTNTSVSPRSTTKTYLAKRRSRERRQTRCRSTSMSAFKAAPTVEFVTRQ